MSTPTKGGWADLLDSDWGGAAGWLDSGPSPWPPAQGRALQDRRGEEALQLPAAAVMVSAAQLCPTLCDPVDCSPPGSSVHGISQARGLEWAATPSSRGPSQPRDEPRDPALQADSLPSEPPGKPHNRSTLSYCRTASGNLRSGKITEGRRTGTEPALRPVLGKGEQAEAEPGLD